MKVTCTGSIEIFAPVERVFDVLADIEKWPAWFAGIVSAQQPDHLPIQAKEDVYVCLHAGRRRWHESFEVSRFVRNAFLTFEGAYSAARRLDFRVEQRSGFTRFALTIGYAVFGGRLGAAIDSAFRRRSVQRLVNESLQHLKHRVEDAVDLPSDLDELAIPHASVVPLPPSLRSRASEPARAT